MLEDLDEKQRKKFCAAILDRREEPRVRRAALENKDIVDITDALVTHFTESGAKEVALQTLREIGCNAQRESFGGFICPRMCSLNLFIVSNIYHVPANTHHLH